MLLNCHVDSLENKQMYGYHLFRQEKLSWTHNSLGRHCPDLNLLVVQLDDTGVENPLGFFPFVAWLLPLREQPGVFTPQITAPHAQLLGLFRAFPPLNSYLVAF